MLKNNLLTLVNNNTAEEHSGAGKLTSVNKDFLINSKYSFYSNLNSCGALDKCPSCSGSGFGNNSDSSCESCNGWGDVGYEMFINDAF